MSRVVVITVYDRLQQYDDKVQYHIRKGKRDNLGIISHISPFKHIL